MPFLEKLIADQAVKKFLPGMEPKRFLPYSHEPGASHSAELGESGPRLQILFL